MAGDPVIGHILDERAADLASGPRAQEGAQDWFVTRLSTHQPSFGPRDPSTRGVLRYSRECVEEGFCELRGDGVLRSLLPEMVTWHMYPLCKGDSVPPKKTSVLGGG
jgi:hypothetical protein